MVAAAKKQKTHNPIFCVGVAQSSWTQSQGDLLLIWKLVLSSSLACLCFAYFLKSLKLIENEMGKKPHMKQLQTHETLSDLFPTLGKWEIIWDLCQYWSVCTPNVNLNITFDYIWNWWLFISLPAYEIPKCFAPGKD